MSTAATNPVRLHLPSPIGELHISCDGEDLIAIDIDVRSNVRAHRKQSVQHHQVVRELNHYFHNPHHQFDLPIKTPGTAFQQRVWRALRKIPSGQTMTYGELAKRLHSSARAVGNACRANPLPVIIPCHRVVAANGLGGYSGETCGRQLNIKRWLLQHEGVTIE